MTTKIPDTLRIAHLADTHLGYSAYGKADPESGRNQRAVDIEASIAAAITDILQQNVDLVLHAGDVFHHTRPSWSTLTHFIRQMRRLEAAGLPAVVIAGNHDTPRLRTTGSVYALLALALPNVHFVAGYEAEKVTFEHLGLVVHAVPHGALTNPDPPEAMPTPGMRNVVVAHGVVPGYVYRGHEPAEADVPGNLLAEEHHYIALGHVHLREKAGMNAYYCGSTERTSWGDEPAQPGYALVTIGEGHKVPRVEYIDLSARPMATLAPIDGADRSARDLADMILARAGALGEPEAMVRVELRQTPRPLFREVDAIVRRETGANAWHIRVMAHGEDLDGLGPGPDGDLNPRVLFTKFVTEKESSGEYEAAFAGAFRERGTAALERAIHRLQEASASESTA